MSKTRKPGDVVTVLGNPIEKLHRAAVLAIGGIKGGIGKSTSAIYLGTSYHKTGVNVLVVDCDPGSATTSGWSRRAKERNQPLPFTVKRHPAEDIEETIVEEGWHQQYQLIILDTGGDSDRILRASYAICDYMLLTASPSPADLDTLPRTAQATVGQMGSRAVPERLVLTAVKTDRMAKNAKSLLRGAGIDVLTNTVSHSVNYQDAYGWPLESVLDYGAVHFEIEETAAA